MFCDFAHKSKNLYNHANFLVRKEFINNNKWLRYGEMDNFQIFPRFVKLDNFVSFQQVRFIPNFKSFTIELVYNVEVPDMAYFDNGRYLSVDIGLDN